MNASAATPSDQVDKSARVFFMLVSSLVFLVGLVLNGFTLKVYFCGAREPGSTSSVTVYLKNLAAADFLISLCLPVRILNYASRSVRIHLLYCNFGASAFYLNMYASILFMGYIAANRYLKIVRPLGSHTLQTVPAAYVICTLTWVFLLVVTSVYVLLSLLAQDLLRSAAVTERCDVQRFSLFNRIAHGCSAAIFLLVLVSLVVFYRGTSRQLALVQRRRPGSPSSKKLARSRRNMLVLVGVFCVCFVPYHLFRLPYNLLKLQQHQAFFYLKELTIMMSALNVCLDPLIYFIFCKAFRTQLNLRRAQVRSQAETTRRAT